MKTAKQKAALIEQLKRTPIVQIACEKAGVGRASYYRWRKDDPIFVKASDDAITEGLLLMNDMAESQLLSAVRDKNLPAIIFWLKHHHTSYKTRIEVSGEIKTNEPLTEEQKELIKEALRLASFNNNLLTPPENV